MLNPYVFPLAILIMKGVQFTLPPLCLGLLDVLIGECIDNIVWAMECYNVITHADSDFLQVFL